MSFAVVSWIRARGHIVGATYRKALHEKNSDLIVSEDKSRMCLQNQEKKEQEESFLRDNNDNISFLYFLP